MLDALDLPNLLRIAISVWILVVLVRSARNAWSRRDLLFTIWRGMTWGVWVRAIALFALVAVVATTLLTFVPLLRLGLGSLVAFEGNAVFTPLEQAAGALGPAPEVGPDWALAALTTAFLGFLVLLLPWLAFIEEEVFRAGIEVLDRKREAWAALKFGLAHLIMLVPLGAVLAISVAGWVYGRTYRRVALGPPGARVPDAVLGAFRPTKRSRQAARERTVAEARHRVAAGVPAVTGIALEDAAGSLDVQAHLFDVERLQAAGVLHAATFHAAFNTLVVAIVWAAIVVPALTR